MPTYVVRTTATLDFVVDADDERDAKRKAEEEAFNYDEPDFGADLVRLATPTEADDGWADFDGFEEQQ